MREDTGQPHPSDINRPKLRGDCYRYFTAYRELGEDRVWNQVGPCPIPMSEIESYLRMTGITDPYTQSKYRRLVKKLDRVELTFLRASSKAPK